MDLKLMTADIYQEVLTRIANGEKFLDLGCCFGQEIRQLVFDGAPSINTYGSDIWGEFMSIGYDLFRDKDRLQTTFITADVFDNSSPLTQLAGQMNIIYTGAFFHLFNLEEQEKVAVRIVELLVPRPGSLIIGQHSGNENSGEYSRSGESDGPKHFRHNPQSWKEFWDKVGEKTESRWSVEADVCFPEFTLPEVEGKSTAMQTVMGAKALRFTVKRL
jgi:hypothetical protein